jgi:RNA polymerase sigma-70 factor, ECF subfamily
MTVYRSVRGESQDAALVSLAANGDGEAFALLYRRYRRDVWTLCFYLCLRNHHDAEEAMQETFLKAWHGLHKYRAKGTFKSWLLTICRNVCVDRVHRAPTKPVALEACAEHEVSDHASSSDHLERILLRATLAKLLRDECEAWFLVDVLGCTSEEAAQIVGSRAASTVRSRVTRARLQIADALSDDPAPVIPTASETEICGLYHSPLEKAIVAALMQRSAQATAGSRSTRFVRARRTNITRDDAYQAGRSCGLNVAGWPPSGIRDGFDLIGFLDELDGSVPTGTPILTIVYSPGTAATERWCDGHPHWQLRHTSADRSWRTEAERLLVRCTPLPAQHRTRHVLALLDGAIGGRGRASAVALSGSSRAPAGIEMRVTCQPSRVSCASQRYVRRSGCSRLSAVARCSACSRVMLQAYGRVVSIASESPQLGSQ